MIQLPDFSPKHAAPKKELKAFILKNKNTKCLFVLQNLPTIPSLLTVTTAPSN